MHFFPRLSKAQASQIIVCQIYPTKTSHRHIISKDKTSFCKPDKMNSSVESKDHVILNNNFISILQITREHILFAALFPEQNMKTNFQCISFSPFFFYHFHKNNNRLSSQKYR